ncbi:MAG: serine/threonine-protein kinase [Planctomycetota bacterium]
MSPDQYTRVRAAFHGAMDLPEHERADYVRARCADDETVLRETLAMLDAESRAGDDDADPITRTLGAPPAPAGVPSAIGGFRIVREIGAGAVGTVYEAEQASPKRSVALKVLRRADPGGRLARRFELEAEVLGRLVHPGVARVYASGVGETPGGPRRYIAMELVDGEPITHWVRGRDTPLDERLRLFARVCDAVHHAHQRGVIHRDLKPANIFVTQEGDPKVLDFGIARAFDDEDAATGHTIQGEVLGTLDYMSPEQGAGDTSSVDVRTDVYALGAVLFDLVADQPALDTRTLSLASALDAVRSAPRPRLRDTTAGVDPDLDLIAATALDLDRERRYASADALASDVRRLLAREPIAARPPSTLYLLAKFAQRRRAAVASIALVALTLVGATAFSIDAAAEARRSVGAAQTAAPEARAGEALAPTAADEARAAEREADRERIEAQQTLALVTDALVAANPNIRGNAQYTVRAFLTDFATTLDERGAPSDNAEAQLRGAIGDAFLGLGQPQPALAQLERAGDLREATLGPDHPETLAMRILHAVALLDIGRTDEGRTELTSLRARALDTLGPNHQQTIDATFYLASATAKAGDNELAEPLYRALMEAHLERHGEFHNDTAAAMGSLAIVLLRLERYEEALPFSERAVEIDAHLNGAEHPFVLTSRNNLGQLYVRLGRYDEAERIYREVLEVRRRVLPASHRHIGVTLGSLGQLYTRTERYEEAERYHTAAHAHFLEHQGPDHPYTAIAADACAGLYELLGMPEKADAFRP